MKTKLISGLDSSFLAFFFISNLIGKFLSNNTKKNKKLKENDYCTHTHLFASVTTKRDRVRRCIEDEEERERGKIMIIQQKGGRNQTFGFGFIYRVYH